MVGDGSAKSEDWVVPDLVAALGLTVKDETGVWQLADDLIRAQAR